MVTLSLEKSKKSADFQWAENLTENDWAEIIKNSPDLQRHYAETRRIFNNIPKEELAKVLKR